MENLEDIFYRLRYHFKAKNDKDLAAILNIPYKTMCSWKFKKHIPKFQILNMAKIGKVSVDYILKGDEGYKQITVSNLSNNTNSAFVIGSNVVSSINPEDEEEAYRELFPDGIAGILRYKELGITYNMTIGGDLLKFIKLFNEYGNKAALQKCTDILLKIKESI